MCATYFGAEVHHVRLCFAALLETIVVSEYMAHLQSKRVVEDPRKTGLSHLL